MRILMISHAYPPTFGGVESHVWDISHRLLRAGHAVAVLSGDQDLPGLGAAPVRRYDCLSARTMLVAHAHRPDGGGDARLLAAIRDALATEFDAFRPDLVHVHNAHHFGPELARACLDLADAPVLNGVHDRVGEHLVPEVLDWPWATVVYASEYLHRALPTRRPAAVRWLGIDLDAFAPDGAQDDRLARLPRPIVFHPARLLRWKGAECGVNAFAKVHAEVGGSLVMCASNDIIDDPREVAAFRSELTALADRLGVGSAVHFADFAKDGMPAAYRTADLVWYPTIEEEPLGLAPIEAMACGAPLVVSRSGGMRETVRDGQTGLVVAKNNPAALATAALTMLRDDAMRVAMVRDGLTHARQFGVDDYVGWLEGRYREAVDLATADAPGVLAPSGRSGADDRH